MTDFSTYQPPGVYIEEDIPPLASTVGVEPSVVAIVGPSRGYREATEAIVLTGTTPVELANLGINTTTGFTVSDVSGTVFAGSNYALVVGPGEDEDEETEADNTTTIARTGGSTIPSGSTVYVRYRYTDPTYFDPILAVDLDDVTTAFGEPFDTTSGAISSPLALAAKIAFENGVTQVVAVPTAGDADATTRSELTAAYTKLAAFFNVNLVVPLPVGLTGTPGSPGDILNIGTDLKTHVDQQAVEGLFRMGVLGYERTVTVLPDTVATTVASQRVMLAWPNRMSYYNGYTNEVVEVSGYYLAAAYAARMAAQEPQMPLTKKVIRGFAGIVPAVLSTMSTTQKNTWSAAGVAVTEQMRDGRLVVRHGTTTDRTNIMTREASLVRAKDALVRLLQDTTERNNLVGIPIEDDTPARVKGVIAGALEVAKNAVLIISWMDLKVRQRSVDPSIIEVKFAYKPAYPLNYILVTFSINTTTGETGLTQIAA